MSNSNKVKIGDLVVATVSRYDHPSSPHLSITKGKVYKVVGFANTISARYGARIFVEGLLRTGEVSDSWHIGQTFELYTPKFKAGDKVVLKAGDSSTSQTGTRQFTSIMKRSIEKVDIVASVDLYKGIPSYQLINTPMNWDENWLELSEAKEEPTKPRFKVGDKVIFVGGDERVCPSTGDRNDITKHMESLNGTEMIISFHGKGHGYGVVGEDFLVLECWLEPVTETREVTIEEIEKKFGCKVKIISTKS